MMDRNDELVSMLDRLGEVDRGEPHTDFHARIAAQARHGRMARPVPGRRLRRMAPVGVLMAAVIGVVVILPVVSSPTATDFDSVAGSESGADGEVLLASFDMFDDAFGLNDELSNIGMDLDEAGVDSSELFVWIDEGGSL